MSTRRLAFFGYGGDAGVEHLGHNLLLRGEVIVEARGLHAAHAGDVTHTCLGVAAFAKETRRVVEDQPTGPGLRWL